MIIKTTVTPRYKLPRVKASFKEKYDSLPRNRQPEFRAAVMASQGWTHATSFYDAINGRAWLKRETVADIEAILKKFGI